MEFETYVVCCVRFLAELKNSLNLISFVLLTWKFYQICMSLNLDKDNTKFMVFDNTSECDKIIIDDIVILLKSVKQKSIWNLLLTISWTLVLYTCRLRQYPRSPTIPTWNSTLEFQVGIPTWNSMLDFQPGIPRWNSTLEV